MTQENGLWFLDAQVKIRLSGEDNADRLSIVEHRMAGGFAPPLHVHHDEDETFQILDGDFHFERDDQRVSAGPGDTIFIPRGTRHGFRVVSAEGGRCLTFTRGGFEHAIRAVSRPALFDGVPAAAEPTPILQAAMARLFSRNGIDLIGPPIA